jgi:hypothetical protein
MSGEMKYTFSCFVMPCSLERAPAHLSSTRRHNTDDCNLNSQYRENLTSSIYIYILVAEGALMKMC